MSDPLLDKETADRATRALVSQLIDEEHPDVDTQLTPYVDGELAGEAREAIEQHLAFCARCREDVVDLRATQEAIRPQSHAWRWLAVAAVVLLAIAGAIALLRRTPAPSPSAPLPTQVTQTTTTTTNPIAPATDEHPEWRASVE